MKMGKMIVIIFTLAVLSQVYGDINPSNSILSSDFQQWLDSHGYIGDDFARGNGFSYGGRTSSFEVINKTPIIFVHGNSDKAVGTLPTQRGWTDSINYFLSQGYRQCEMYAMTYGPANAIYFTQQYHSLPYVTRVRRFIQAVKSYTGHSKIHVIAHSMGVTMSRKAIKGGTGHDALNGGFYDLGSPLSYVDTFVGIAGANEGIASCFFSGPITPTCGSTNGFYPGYLSFGFGPYGVSQFLTQLNANSAREATNIYTIWTTVDEIVGSLVYGKRTSRINSQNGEKIYYLFPYGHNGVKELTASVQHSMVNHNYP